MQFVYSYTEKKSGEKKKVKCHSYDLKLCVS